MVSGRLHETAGRSISRELMLFDSFRRRLESRLSAFKVGDPLDETTDMGAIINRSQFESICGYIEDGIQQPGAELVLGGLPPSTGPLAEGYFLEPTVFANVSNDWRIAREEIFGPLEAMLDGFTQIKSVTVSLQASERREADGQAP